MPSRKFLFSLVLSNLLVFIISETAISQNNYFHYRFANLEPNTDGLFKSFKIEATPDGGFVIVNLERQTYTIAVAKIDACGEVEWAKRYSNFPNILLSGLLVDAEGNVAMFFQLFGLSVSSYVYAIKLDWMGNTLWQKRYVFGDGTGFSKADFHETSDGRYCFGAYYINQLHTFFLDPSTGDIDDAFRVIGSGGTGNSFYGNLPNGNLLIRRGGEWISYNLVTESIDWTQRFNQFGAWRHAKQTIADGRMVFPMLSPNGSVENRFVLAYFDTDGKYLFSTDEIAGNQHTSSNHPHFPYKLTAIADKGFALATTQQVPEHQITLLVFDSLGRQVQTRHFHPKTNAFRMAHDQALLNDGSLAIVGESDGRVEVLKIPLDNAIGFCENDTVSIPPYPSNIIMEELPPMPIQVEKVQIPVEDIQTTEEEIELEVENICNTAPVFPNLDSSFELCWNDSVLVSAAQGLTATCTWDDGYEGCERVLYPGDGSKTASVWVDCASFSHHFLIEEKTDCHCSVYLPTVFSPNADGVNDTFQPLSNCPLINFDLKVFDRWGELVYHSTDAGMGWDGNVRGLSAQNGVYVFLLKYQPNNGVVEVVEKGEVSLLR